MARRIRLARLSGSLILARLRICLHVRQFDTLGRGGGAEIRGCFTIQWPQFKTPSGQRCGARYRDRQQQACEGDLSVLDQTVQGAISPGLGQAPRITFSQGAFGRERENTLSGNHALLPTRRGASLMVDRLVASSSQPCRANLTDCVTRNRNGGCSESCGHNGQARRCAHRL